MTLEEKKLVRDIFDEEIEKIYKHTKLLEEREKETGKDFSKAKSRDESIIHEIDCLIYKLRERDLIETRED